MIRKIGNILKVVALAAVIVMIFVLTKKAAVFSLLPSFKSVFLVLLGVLTPVVVIALVSGVFYFGHKYKKEIKWGKVARYAVILTIIAVVVWQSSNFISSFKSDLSARQKAVVVYEAAKAPTIQEFRFNKGDEGPTVIVGPGTKHRIDADNEWVAIAVAVENGKTARIPYSMPKGVSYWAGDNPVGPLLVKGLKNNTKIVFYRLR